MSARLLVDWGTSSLRAWVVDEAGAVQARVADDKGIARLSPGQAAQVFADDVRAALNAETMPALLCGTVGAALGLIYVPYCPCPAGPADLAAGAVRYDEHTVILPGVQINDARQDVMRGEETQIMGRLALHPALRVGRHLFCLPGSHSKWVQVKDGRIETFMTAATGELFYALVHHSILARGPSAPDEAAFDEGARIGLSGASLSTAVFGARARPLVGVMAATAAQSFLSGVLIGAELHAVQAMREAAQDGPIRIISSATLGAPYLRALGMIGHQASYHDGEDAALAGLLSIGANLS